MDGMLPAILIGIPTAIGAAIGAAKAVAGIMAEERKRMEEQTRVPLKIGEVLKADVADSSWKIIWGAGIGAVFGLAAGVVLSCAAWFKDSIFGAKESSDTIRRMIKRSASGEVPDLKPALASAPEKADARHPNYAQWRALEKGRAAKTQVHPLGRQVVAHSARRMIG